jgi:ribose-phosphate pyrophosphokinase
MQKIRSSKIQPIGPAMANARVNDNMMVFTGNANPALAAGVVKQLGIPLGKADVSKFSDGEVMVEINENVRGKDVFVLQSTCAPTNDNLMEIMLMVDALKRASAGRITAAIPYFGYARQDRRPRSARVAISAKVVANMLEEAGVDRIMIMDLHADQIQGFFDIPVDNIYASPILLGDLVSKNYDNLLVVSRTSAVWYVPALWQNASAAIWRLSINAVRKPMCQKS